MVGEPDASTHTTINPQQAPVTIDLVPYAAVGTWRVAPQPPTSFASDTLLRHLASPPRARRGGTPREAHVESTAT